MRYEKQVLKYAREMGYDSVDFMAEWNGYEAYDPYNKDVEDQCNGFCTIILANDKEVRFTDEDEAVSVTNLMDKRHEDS